MALNTFVGFIVGVAGGLIGLGGAELRLPYLVTGLRLSSHMAVRVNLAVSLFTILAALPARFATLPDTNLAAYVPEVSAIAVAAIVAAFLGAGVLSRLPSVILARIIAGLLVVLGVGLLVEASLEMTSPGFLPDALVVRVIAGIVFGFAIGLVSSLLGVAGGEVIIPTLVFAYGVPIKAAGSLSLLISLPTVLTGLSRHVRSGFLRDRQLLVTLILPMGVGSAAGAVAGGTMIGVAPVGALKVGLGCLLVWSAWKIATHKGK